MGLLEGKKALVMGVGNKRSIAWGIATAFQREGADLAFNWPNERLKDNVLELVATLPNHESIPVGPCDVSKQDEIDKFFAEMDRKWGRLDILVHSIAFAAIEDLKSVMSLTYNAVDRVVPSYNSMAMAKAVLEAETRYLAADLGPHNVRVNAISAGPLKTLAGSAVRGISQARDLMVEKAPLRRNITQDEVGNVAVFLASEWSRAVTGATIFADNGFNIIGVTE
ncbi:MAG: SDR family oxidoreductase [Chloroflexi bacterium]|nr:MAG: SDR family oxidoreductase [Chloroflexota bacterium]